MRARTLLAGAAMGSVAAIFAVGLVVAAPLASGDPTDKEGRRAQSRAARPAKELPIFTPAREAAALAFVAQHHPELRKLLKSLADADKQAYEQAVCEIFAETEALADVLAKDVDVYAIALEEWKVRSRIHLLIARMREGTPTPEQERKIESLVRKQVELELERKKKELSRFEQMLERRRGDLAQRGDSMEKTVQNRLKRLLKKDN